MFVNPFTNATNKILKEFGEEYIRLAKTIIMFNEDDWNVIEEAERDIKKKMLMNEKTSFRTEREALIHFMRLKINLIERNINQNPGVKVALDTISTYMRRHSLEVKTLGLAFKDGKRLTPTELYVNYYCLLDIVPGLVAPELYRKKK